MPSVAAARATSAGNPVFVALDTKDLDRAARLARDLAGLVGGLKLGLEFFSAHGPSGVSRLAALGQPVFLDLKLHDIPNTVAGAVGSLVPLAPTLITVHATGGPDMLRAAARAAADGAAASGVPRPRVLGVTVLTSLDRSDMAAIGLSGPPADRVGALAALSRDCGLDGVVCAPPEVRGLRAAFGPDFTLMVPGIRPAGADMGDQKRAMTPAEAIAAGADHLVIGRPITAAPDPVAAARDIVDGISDRP